MEIRRFFTAVLFLLAALLLLPRLASAEVEVPYRSVWYLHVDLAAMNTLDSRVKLYQTLDDKTDSDFDRELLVNLNKEIERMTAFLAEGDGIVVLLEGELSQESKQKLLSEASEAEEFEEFQSGGKTFYFIRGKESRGYGREDSAESLGKGVYFSFDFNRMVVLASKRDTMEGLLANNGKVPDGTSSEALFQLNTAESLLHGGLKIEEMDGAGDWQSNVLNNAEQITFMVKEAADKLAIEAQLMVKEPDMAESLANILRGLVSLQVFSSDMDPDFAALLRSVKINVDNGVLNVTATVDPESLSAGE